MITSEVYGDRIQNVSTFYRLLASEKVTAMKAKVTSDGLPLIFVHTKRNAGSDVVSGPITALASASPRRKVTTSGSRTSGPPRWTTGGAARTSLTLSLTLTHPLTHSINPRLTHSLTPPLTHRLTHSPTHSLSQQFLRSHPHVLFPYSPTHSHAF